MTKPLKILESWIRASIPPVDLGGEKKVWRFSPLYSGGLLDVDGFDVPVVLDIQSLLIDDNPPALLDHDISQVVGYLKDISKVGNKSVNCQAIVQGTPFSEIVNNYQSAGYTLKPSIGATRIREQDKIFVDTDETLDINGRRINGPFWAIYNASLVEGSFVTIGGDQFARAELAARIKYLKANLGGLKKMTWEEFLQSKKVTAESFEAMTDEEKAALKAEFESGGGSAEAGIDDETVIIDQKENGSETAIKEAVTEAVAEAIEEMPASEAVGLYVNIAEEVANETESQLTAECGEEEIKEEDKEKVTAKAKRIAAGILKKKMIKAKLKESREIDPVKESRRVNSIKAVCSGYGKTGSEIAGKAIAHGWDFEKTQKAIKACLAKNKGVSSMPKQINWSGSSGGKGLRRQDVVTAAFAGTCGMKPDKIKKAFKFSDDVINASLEKENRNVTFKRLIAESVNSFSPGSVGIGSDQIEAIELMRLHCKEQALKQRLNRGSVKAGIGYSTISATDVLHAVLEAYLLEPLELDEQIYKTITKEIKYTDFNQVDSYLPTLIGELKRISDTGQLEHVGYTTEKFSGGTEPRGAMFSIPETVLINDRLDVFVELLRQLNNLPEQCIEHDCAATLWGMLDGDITYQQDHQAFFSSARGNLITGADSALSTTGLALAENALDSFKDKNGNGISSSGSFILCGSKIYPQALRVFQSENLNLVDAIGEKNIYYNAYKPVKWKLLNSGFANAKKADGTTASYLSAKADDLWILMRDPQRRPIMHVNKLVGYESPQLKQFDSDPSVWGTTYQLIYPYRVTSMWADGAVVCQGN